MEVDYASCTLTRGGGGLWTNLLDLYSHLTSAFYPRKGGDPHTGSPITHYTHANVQGSDFSKKSPRKINVYVCEKDVEGILFSADNKSLLQKSHQKLYTI